MSEHIIGNSDSSNDSFLRYFEYPIDNGALISEKRKIKRRLMQRGGLLEKRIAVLSGSTTNEVVNQLELFLLCYGIRPIFFTSNYGQWHQETIMPPDDFKQFSPDIVYIHTSWRNISVFPKIESSETDIEALIEEEYVKYEAMWRSLDKMFHCPVIQNNFDRPYYRSLGNRDIWDIRGKSNFIMRLNQRFYDYAKNNDNFYINDIDYISADYGISKWNNAIHWHMYKYAMDIPAIPYLAQSVSNIIKSIYGLNQKALILDLDNTLWGGIIGDDGAEGIELGSDIPKGEAFLEFQRYCLELKNRGVLLAVATKNEEKNAMTGLTHPDSALCPEDFVNIKANWNSKDKNIIDISNELCLNTDSFVFVDDNPAEREVVSRNIPSIKVVDIDDVENFIKAIDHNGYFEPALMSDEDRCKTGLYRAREKLKIAESMFSNYDAYLGSLNMEAIVTGFERKYIRRITQLVNKSNQFNLTTIRCSENEVLDLSLSAGHICLCGRLIDKYADNGIVTVIVGEKMESQLHIRIWLMSCRVFKRGLEEFMMNDLVERAANAGINEIFGYYFPSSKNGMVKDFYGVIGFEKIQESENGETEWMLKVESYRKRKVYIRET